jgi:hypothetical protein
MLGTSPSGVTHQGVSRIEREPARPADHRRIAISEWPAPLKFRHGLLHRGGVVRCLHHAQPHSLAGELGRRSRSAAVPASLLCGKYRPQGKYVQPARRTPALCRRASQEEPGPNGAQENSPTHAGGVSDRLEATQRCEIAIPAQLKVDYLSIGRPFKCKMAPFSLISEVRRPPTTSAAPAFAAPYTPAQVVAAQSKALATPSYWTLCGRQESRPTGN